MLTFFLINLLSKVMGRIVLKPRKPANNRSKAAICLQSIWRRFLAQRELQLLLGAAAAALVANEHTHNIGRKKLVLKTSRPKNTNYDEEAAVGSEMIDGFTSEFLCSLSEGTASKDIKKLNKQFASALEHNRVKQAANLIDGGNVHPCFENFDGLIEAASNCNYNVVKLVMERFTICTEIIEDMIEEAEESECPEDKITKFKTLFT